MKISVLVPVYNIEKYIARCAQSLFEQTFKDVEYIFVDDCSTDNSSTILREVANSYPSANVHIIRHEHNRGSGAARLTGMKTAKGEFITFVDGDDFIPKNALEVLAKKQEETGADMIDGASDSFTDDNFYDKQVPYKGKNYAEKMIMQNIVPHHMWARLIRRSIFTDNGILFKEGVNQAEDYSVMCRVAYYASMAWTDEVVYHYRQGHSTTFSDHISPHHIASFIEAHHIVYSFYRDKERKYQFPLHTGLVNVGYHAVKAGMSEHEALKKLEYKPHGLLFRMADFFLSHKALLPLARLEYLVMKRVYLMYKG